MMITPHVDYLRSLRGVRADYIKLICEAVDNSLDAGSTNISISIAGDNIAFKDNGRGVERERIGALFTIGEHAGMSTTQLGRYGIGIKEQAISAGTVFDVDSTSKDGRFKITVNWANIVKSGKWEID